MFKHISCASFLMLLLIVIGSSLVVRPQHKQGTRFQHDLSTIKLQHLIHAHHAQIPQNVYDQLLNYAKSDPEISQSIKNNQPLSAQSAQKVKNFFLSNKQFQDFSFNTLFSRASNPDCFTGMKDETKVKLLKTILDHWDFSVIFLTENHETSLERTQSKKIMQRLNADQEISPYLSKCFTKSQ